MQRRVVDFLMKAASGDGSTGDGLGAAFHNIDTYGEIISPGAFIQDLPRFLSEGFIGGLNHDWDNPIGKPTAAAETTQGLAVSWAISDTSHGRDVKILLKDGVIKKLSIGFQTIGREWLETSAEVEAYWQKHNYTPSAEDVAAAAQGSIKLLTRIRLYEVSPVTVPANSRADITGVKDAKSTERVLIGLGFDRIEAARLAATLAGEEKQAPPVNVADAVLSASAADVDATLRAFAATSARLTGATMGFALQGV